ncbi:1-acyl-sn-glycerol-3-phosphate acyltransferase [Aurantibacillus circumpalustris]|uniref:1-acyl-sn-glycerol-3-phosphate acyltransferase n=1 Tax=Aurantibacillus circumpalustris TaxID=3036359 RepID=UPI00295AFFC4|nr:1-acyl-sn-glycerol-3-phosphate acyltransferase [Aurantibacillus circumpalustris]
MLALRLYTFFQRHKTLLFALVVILLIFFGYFSTKLKREEDITKFIPKDGKIDEINFILQNLKIKDKLVINLFNADTSVNDPSEMMACADKLADTLLNTNKDFIKELNYKVSNELMMQTYGTFYENLPIFLEEKDYQKIEGLLIRDSVNSTLKSDYRTLLSPSGMVLGRYLKRDPLNLTPIALKKIQSLQFDENFEVNEGYIQTKDKKNLLLFITPSVNPNESDANKKFIESLDGTINNLSKQFDGKVTIEYYGATPVAAGNAAQIRHDSIFTSLIALAVIMLMLFLFFRRLLVILYILLPVAFGGLFSLTLLYFIKGEISAIALGAGSIVLGIAINYSLHFFTHYKHERSVKKVIEDLTLPMLVGCATTVAAFLSLQFAKSQALHDFGLFAGFSLIGAVLFSIIVLPHLLKSKKESQEENHDAKPSIIDKALSYPMDKNKSIVILAFLLTLVFAYTASYVEFESDMMKMNYQSDKLNKAQENIERINKYSLKSVYVISKGKNLNEALKANERASEKLSQLKKDGSVGKYSSVSTVLISDSLQKIRIDRWNDFWTKARKDSLRNNLIQFGSGYKFKEDAFSEFYNLLNKDFKVIPLSHLDSLKKLVANEWITENKDLTTIVNLVKSDPETKQKVYDAFSGVSDVLVFDKQYMTNQFVEIISSDFNLILMITAFLVFGFMLLSHGRIELAIINFIPMFVSWLWILGIMGILGLKFNIINIIISTFIFGLGDDYSIFIMDGLGHEYKYGRKNLASYKTSIFLSALTNIVGIGVLIFAKHPALKSIAAITIIGMCTVLFISFIIQPLFYNFLILNRRKRGLLPYTLFNLLITGLGFSIFVAGSIVTHSFAFLLFHIIPAPRKKKKLLFHYIIMYVCRIMVYLVANVKKNIINPDKEKFKKPSIIISNHQSHIDLALILMLHPKIVVFTNDAVWNNPFYGVIVRMADFYPASRGYENALTQMKELTNDGYSVLIFPEGTRSQSGEILRFHKGAFYLAEQLQLEILPLLLHGAGDLVTKGDFHFKEGEVTLKYFPRILPNDTAFGSAYKEKSKNVREYMRSEYAQLRLEKETVNYFRPRLIKNYIYKGPILEWYCRIKTKLEGNYENFEKYLPKKGKIIDVGCGYGFLSLMLGFMSKDREILGLDYDDEKINIASNCVSKNSKTNFIHADVTQYEFVEADAFIINDVLHYLEPEQQINLIKSCVNKLNKNGVMIVRDADADKKKRHMGTRYTEFFSTNSGFNKTKESGLHFTSADLIKNTLNSFNFIEYKLIDDTTLTSNVTFVIHYKN